MSMTYKEFCEVTKNIQIQEPLHFNTVPINSDYVKMFFNYFTDKEHARKLYNELRTVYWFNFKREQALIDFVKKAKALKMKIPELTFEQVKTRLGF